jgi:pyruvate/2-oxoglutarate dehydrogenase complex dihydrolipoamide dehydrogenase (E3) component
MSQRERFEILILGSGAGGKLLAWHMGRSGRRTAVVERRWIGGSCPNINCLPSKNEIWGAKVADLVHHAAQFGTMTGPVAIDMAKERKRAMVDAEIAGHLRNYETSGAELIMGAGRFVAPKTLEVRLNDGGTRGTHATIPSVPGLAAARPLTNIEALELDHLPPHLIVLGGGYVGLEFAQAYRRFGSRVTVIQHGPQLMAQEDLDVADEVQRILSDEGIQVLVAADTLHVHGRSGEEVRLVVRTTSGEQNIEGSDILVAAGVHLTPPVSGSRRPALRWTIAATFASMSGWRRVRPRSGPSGNVPVAHSSRTYPTTTFGSSRTIWPGRSAARAIGWFHTACSRTLHSLAWD